MYLIASQKGYADGGYGTVFPEIAEFEEGESSTKPSADTPIQTDSDGTATINPAWLEKNNLKKLEEITAMGSKISNAGSGLTQDPKTASYIAAGGSALGATGALIGSAHHLNQANTYRDASNQNQMAAEKTMGEVGKIEGKIQAENTKLNELQVLLNNATAVQRAQEANAASAGTDQAKAQAAARKAQAAAQRAEKAQTEMSAAKAKIAELSEQKVPLAARLAKQEALESEYFWGSGASYLMSGIGLVSSVAMGGTAAMQLEQGRQLASDNEYCAKHPNEFPRCTEVPPQGNNTPLDPNQNPPVSLNDPGFSGFNRNGADEDNFSPASTSAAGLGAAPTASSAGLPSFGSGLSGGGDRNPSKEKEELDDIGGSGFSGDQTYEGGGGNIDQLGSGAIASSLLAPPFDISQFLPANLREDEFQGVLAAKINDKEKEGIVLGKESPSLFTRISRAYQKRAHEMLKGVI